VVTARSFEGPRIAGIGIAHPPAVPQQELWDGFFANHYGGVQRALAKRIFANSGVDRRHAAVNPTIEDISGWSTARRIQRYLPEAMPLGKAAISDALDQASLSPDEIGMFAVCSCTGYVTPGLDILLARDLGMAPDTQRLFVGHMGCYAALPGLGVVRDRVLVSGRPALLLCCELTSLHVQPASAEADQIVSHALFADAAAAVVVVPSAVSSTTSSATPPSPAAGLKIVEVASVTDLATSDHMTWDVTDLGFRMGLSSKVPDVLSQRVAPLVDDLLARHGLGRSDIDGWAVHPGGPRILDVIERQLELPTEALLASRTVLAEHGNCSSPTVLMVLESLMRRPQAPERVLMLAFGPGLTLYAVLLAS
jgi:predicted naringenin-chalcone synthase